MRKRIEGGKGFFAGNLVEIEWVSHLLAYLIYADQKFVFRWNCYESDPAEVRENLIEGIRNGRIEV